MDVVALGAALLFGLSAPLTKNLTQKVSASDPVQIAMLKGLIAGSVNVALALWLGADWPAVPRISAALLVGFVSYGVSIVLFVLALRHIGTARTSAYFSVAPFMGAAPSLVLFPKLPTATFVVAAALMAIGVWLHLSERHEHEHEHGPFEHEHLHVHDEHHRHQHALRDRDREPHSHWRRHEPLVHRHAHYPDIHHRHKHG